MTELVYPYWCQRILAKLEQGVCTYEELAKEVGVNYKRLNKHHEKAKLKRFDHVINAVCWCGLAYATLIEGETVFCKLDINNNDSESLNKDAGIASAIWCFLRKQEKDTRYSLDQVTLSVCKSMEIKYTKELKTTVKFVLQTMMTANIVDTTIDFRWKLINQ